MKRAVLPRAPWLPAQQLVHDDSDSKNGGHGFVANEMRYMPRTVWQ
jgi:hypothetical protein